MGKITQQSLNLSYMPPDAWFVPVAEAKTIFESVMLLFCKSN